MPAGKPRRRERTPEQQADAAAARQERLEDLHRQLADGVAALRDGEAWRGWLDVATRFHHYSFGNQLLIAAQKPDATLVAGYGAWNALGRQVRKGEKALWVLAPVTGRGQGPDRDGVVDANQLDPMTGTPAVPSPGAVTRAGRAVRGFTSVAVFDVSQTDGDPLPTPPRPQLLAGQAPPGLWDALTDVITDSGLTVDRSPDAESIGGANGVTDYVTRTVTVRADVDAAQAAKTLAHEAGHVLLHNPQNRGEGPACRDLIEVEAESVAYLVAAHHGLDTSGYTFAYIAGWACRDDDAVTNTARRVLDAARTLIEATDPISGRGPSASAVVSLAAREATAAADAAEIAQERLSNLARDGAERLHALRAVNSAAQRWFLRQADDQQGLRRGSHRARAHVRRGTRLRRRLGTADVDRTRRPSARRGVHERGAPGCGGRNGRSERSAHRPVPWTGHLPDPRRSRRRRIHGARRHWQSGGPQVPQHPGHRPLRQEPGAVRHPAHSAGHPQTSGLSPPLCSQRARGTRWRSPPPTARTRSGWPPAEPRSRTTTWIWPRSLVMPSSWPRTPTGRVCGPLDAPWTCSRPAAIRIPWPWRPRRAGIWLTCLHAEGPSRSAERLLAPVPPVSSSPSRHSVLTLPQTRSNRGSRLLGQRRSTPRV